MTTIQINNLNSIGSELFADQESYLQDLHESELSTQGGLYSGYTILTTILHPSIWL